MAIPLDHFPRMAWSFGVLFMLCLLQIIPVFAASPDLGSDLSVDQITTNSAKVYWSKPSTTTFDSYVVTVNPPGPSTSTVAPDAASPVVDVTGLTAGQEYTITVRTKEGNVPGTAKNATFNAKPNPLSGGNAITFSVIAGTSATVSWTAATGKFDNYVITISPNDGGAKANPSTVSSSVTTTQLKSLTRGTKYTVGVKTKAGSSESDVISNTFTAGTPEAVGQNTITFTDITTTTAKVKWTKVNGQVSSYTISVNDPTKAKSPAVNPSSVTTNLDTPRTELSGLVPGVQYEITITTVYNGQSSSPVTKAVRTNPHPVDQTKLSVGKKTTTTAPVNWEKVSIGIFDSYSISINPTATITPSSVDKSVQSPSVALSALSPGQQYIVVVKTVSGNRDSAPASVTFTTKPAAVDAGTINFSDVTVNSASVKWTAATGADSYEVTITPKTSTSTTPVVTHNPSSATSASFTMLVPGVEYIVSITAKKGDEKGAATTKPLRTKPPNLGGDVEVEKVESTTADAKWTPPSTGSYGTFTNYKITVTPQDKGVTTPTVDPTTVASSVTSPRVTLKNLVASQVYTISVSSTWDNVEGTAKTKQFRTRPPQVASITISALTPTTATINWPLLTPPSGVTYKYQVDIVEPGPVVSPSEVTVSSTSVIRLEPGKTYKVSVKTVAVTGLLATESRLKVHTFTSKPQPVQKASIKFNPVGTTTATATWTKVSGVLTGYKVSISPTGPTITPAVVPGTTDPPKTEFTKLSPGVKYTVTITTVSGTVESNSTTADFIAKPLKVTNIVIKTRTTTTAKVTWSKVASGQVDRYKISANPPGAMINPATVSGTVQNPETALSSLKPGIQYTLTIQSVAGSATNEEQKIFWTKPLPVTGVTLTQTGVKMTVKWTAGAQSSQSKYKVKYRAVFENPSSTWSEVTVNHPTVKAEIGIKPGEKYEVEVYVISGDQTSDVATGSLVTVPFPPSSVSVNKAAATTTSIEVIWTAPSTTSYFIKYVINYAKEGSTTFQEIEIDATTSEKKKTIPKLDAGVKYTIKVYTKTKNELSDTSADTTGTVKPNCDVKVTDLSDETNKLNASYSKSSLVFTDYKFVISNGPSPATRTRTKDQEPRNLVYTTGVEPGHRYTLKAYCVSNGIESDAIDFHLVSVPAPITRVEPITRTPDSITMTVHKPLGLVSGVTVTCAGHSAGNNIGCTLDKTGGFGTQGTWVVTYDKLESHETYKFTFQVISNGKKSQTYTVTNTTHQGRPSAPDRFTATPTSATTVELKWSTPLDPNGEVSKYVVIYTGTYKKNPALGKPAHTVNATFDVNPKTRSYTETLHGLRGGYSYDFTIYGMTSYPGAGENVGTSITMPVDAPTLLDDAIAPESNGTKSETKIFATFKKSFNESNGPILYYSIIVAQSLKDAVLSGPSPKDDAILPWNKVEDSDTWPPYMAIKKCDIFDTTKSCDGSPATSRKKRSTSSDTVVVTIGLQSCKNTKSGEYCNGPLKPGSNYQLRLRGYTGPNKYYDAPYSEKIPTAPKDQTGMIVGVSVGLLVLLGIASGVAIYFFLKYRKAEKEKRYEEEAQPETTPVDRSRPVRLTDFPGHHEFMHADTDFRFAEEYEDLKDVGITQSYTVSELPYNRVKNRFTNILPYNWSRVKLSPVEDIEGTDYINANYIPGFTSKREYVACQGPLDSTMDDFWRMIWEQNCQAIVMLTRCMENGRQKCAHYWPEDTDPVIYGDIEVVILNETQNTDFAITQLRMTKGGESRRICHFHFLVWPDFSAPEVSGPLLRFLRTFRERVGYDNSRPICVHCSAGVGRSGTFITLDRLTQHMKQHDYVDIFGTVYEMRLHRRYMVQTEQQYIFIHKAILEIISDRVKPQAPSPEGHENEAFEDDEGITLEVLS